MPGLPKIIFGDCISLLYMAYRDQTLSPDGLMKGELLFFKSDCKIYFDDRSSSAGRNSHIYHRAQ